jgi:EmrB/QacA subfamily drug resistance transporter
MTPIAGKLGDLFGRKPFVLGGMVGFVAASAVCGFAQNMVELVIFRAVQGLFAGILFASAFTILADLFTPAVRARMQGLFGGIFGLAAIIGPYTGGWLTDNVGWRWVFYVNVPVGLIAFVVALIGIPYVRSKASWRDIDFLGSLLLAGGLVPLLTALSITRDHAWTSLPVAGLLAIATVLLVLFFFQERRDEHPIVPFGLFRNRTFAVSMMIGFVLGFGMFGGIIYVALVYQGVLGVTATNSGLLLTPMMVGMIGASALSGQVITRITRYRFIGTVGTVCLAFGFYWLSTVTPSTGQSLVVLALVTIGAGMGLCMPLYINAIQSALPRSVVGVASSQAQFWRSVGGTVGTAILGSVLSRQLPVHIQERVASLHLPASVAGRLQSGGSSNPQQLFDPGAIAARRAALPAAAQPAFDNLLHAVRLGLADTLRDVFLFSFSVALLALVISLFLKEAPLRGRPKVEEAIEEALPQPALELERSAAV